MSKFGFDKLVANFEAQKDKIAKDLLEVSKTIFVRQYNAENDPEGHRWTKLADSTLKYKTGNKILVDEGYLLSALANSVRTGSTKWTDCRLIIRNDYAQYHQYGTSKMPQRKILGHNKTLEVAQIKVITDAITKLFII